MAASIRLNDLAGMSATRREAALEALVADARDGGGVSRSLLDARIRRFEERYELPSDELLRRVATGEMKETADVSEWLFLLDSRRAGVAR